MAAAAGALGSATRTSASSRLAPTSNWRRSQVELWSTSRRKQRQDLLPDLLDELSVCGRVNRNRTEPIAYSPAARRRNTGVPEQYLVPTHRFRLLGLSRHNRYRLRFQVGDARGYRRAGPGESESALGGSTPAKGSTNTPRADHVML